MENGNRAARRIEDELSEYGTYATNTNGVSMRPLFRTHRDAVALKKLDREIKKYDILLYTDPLGRYILHRVIGIRGNTLIMRGDNTFKKEYVPHERVLAYMVSFNRKGKHHTVDERGYKLYSRLWNFIYPLRFVMHKIRSLFGKIKRKYSNKN